MERKYKYHRIDPIRATLDALELYTTVRVRITFKPMGSDGTTAAIVDPVPETMSEVELIILGERILDTIEEKLNVSYQNGEGP
jgi:hypothetical protein